MVIVNKMWRVLAAIPSRLIRNPDYYKSLTLLNDPSIEDFCGIIHMDVRRTPGALDDEAHAK